MPRLARLAGPILVLSLFACARTFAPLEPSPPASPPSATAAATRWGAAAPAPEPTARSEPGAEPLDPRALFLDEGDLPLLRRTREPRPHDAKNALLAGAVEWVDPHGDEAVWRVDDERWVFSDEVAARSFFEEGVRDSRGALASVLPPWSSPAPPPGEPPAIGATSRLVGGTGADVHGEPYTVLAYVFVVDRVVARVRVQRGPRARSGSLGVDRVAAIARRAVARIDAALAPRRARE